MTFNKKALPGGVGVEVTDLEVNGPVAPETASALKKLWLEKGIILFRGLGTSPEVLLELSRCFGELEPHPIEHFRLPGYPELILLSNENGLTGPVYEFDGVPTYGRIPWHTDLAFATTPNAGALLRMVKKSEHGGQTGWLDTAMAWEALDAETKQQIEGLEAKYVFCPDLSAMRFNRQNGKLLQASSKVLPTFPPVAHPLVWVHPETGQRILNVSTLNIQSVLGLPQAESDALLEKLIAHTLQPQFQYIHDWEENDIVLWDNRRTMHSAFGHPVDEVRIVQRSTIRGTVQMGRVIEEEQKEQTA